jgi:CPA2 family monovalent cation:H+ antiporter-2
MSHVPQLISDLALILGSAAVALLLFKKLKQPVVLGYLVAGVLVGPHFDFFPSVSEINSIQVWAEIGVIFLLFSLGLEFSFKKLIKVGNSALITGLFEITAMLLLGYLTGKWFGWSKMDSLFLGGIIAISSTSIIFRAFDELNLKQKKFAGLVLGILVIEDLVAVVLMALLSAFAETNQLAGGVLLVSVLKLLFALVLWFAAGIFILPGLFKYATRYLTDETLLVLSLGLCLGMVLMAVGVGFSAALGAFIMGSLLAETTQAERIEHVFKPVKDLFGAVFFVSVGMLIQPHLLMQYLLPVLVLTLVVMLGKTLHVSLGALLAGQPLKQSIQAGTSMSQIGEFSFIIATLGLSLGVISEFLYPIAVGVSVITTFFTPYMMRLAEPLHRIIEKKLPHSWLQRLNLYSAGAQHIQAESDWKLVAKSFTQIVLLNGVILTAIVLLFKNLVEPLLWISGDAGKIITAILALVCMSPFLWMLTTKKINRPSYTQLWLNKYNRGPIILMEFARVGIGVSMVWFLFIQLFSTITALLAAFVIMVMAGYVFKRKLHGFSVKIEKRFLSNLYMREEMQHLKNNKVTSLLPWDAHVAYLDIHSNSTWVGQSLQDLALREKYGLNVVLIERGSNQILIPDRTQQLFPFDKIAIIGTDAQIQLCLSAMNAGNVQIDEANQQSEEVSLMQVTVSHGFPFLGQSIRQSNIRQKLNCLIVGIERGEERILNPDSSTTYQLNDTLWIAGNKKKIKAMLG